MADALPVQDGMSRQESYDTLSSLQSLFFINFASLAFSSVLPANVKFYISTCDQVRMHCIAAFALIAWLQVVCSDELPTLSMVLSIYQAKKWLM